MAGQAKTTKEYAKRLNAAGWNILFVCIPNSVHVGVVPIMTSHGVSKQRYPDIAAMMGNSILLVEVEMSLTNAVADDIVLRFAEMREGLSSSEVYRAWSSKLEIITGLKMPESPDLEVQLLLVNGISEKTAALVHRLNQARIPIVAVSE